MTARNAYTGDAPLAWGEHRLTLRYDWQALAALRTAFADADPFQLLQGGDPGTLAKVLAIGLQRHHPDWTAVRVLDASPPLAVAVDAMALALRYAFWGPGGPPARDDAPAETAAKKPTRPAPTRSRRR